MLVNRPSDEVQDAAAEHVSGPVTLAVPVSWGAGFSTPGMFAFIALWIGFVLGVGAVSNSYFVVAVGAPLLLLWLLIRRGVLGQGILAIAETNKKGSDVAALTTKRWSALKPNGGIRRAYGPGTPVTLAADRRWWQGVRCTVGGDLYYINPNFETEARAALPGGR